MKGAYDGLRVLDLSRDVAGAMAAMYFADQGAEVLRLLPPGHTWREQVARDPGYLCWDRNKLLSTLDRDSADGQAELRRLLAAADLVILDDRPADLEQAGLDADTLLAAHPRLVHLWLPLLGPQPPWRDLPADRLLADAVTTASGEHGSYEQVPVAVVTPLVSYAQAILGATAAAAALLERRRSGRGQGVLVTGAHAAVALQAASLTDAAGVIRPVQTAGGGAPQFHIYRCSDGKWLYLAAMTQPLFVVALDVLDLLDVLATPGMDGDILNMMKPEVGEPVAARLRARFAERTRDEWARLFTAADVPNAPTQSRDEWWASNVVASNGMRARWAHPDLGTVELPGNPIRMSRTPGVLSHLPNAAAHVDSRTMWTDPPAGANANAGAGAGTDADTAAAAGGDADSGPPLAGLRVLDLGSFVAGPFASSLLSDYGAEVIKVESPEGDPYRAFTISFLAFHKGQSAVALDVKSDEGRRVLYDLVRTADVLLDNVRPGVRERIGTDYATLAAINPRLVRGSVTAWGSGNELSETPAFEPLLQARSGLMTAQGGAETPCQTGMLVHDVGTGALLAFGILAALYARDRDGAGQEVATTMVNSSIMMQAGEFVRYEGRPEPRLGGYDHPGDRAAHRLYRCAEGWVAVAATTEEQAAGLARALGLGAEGPDGSAGAGELLAAPASGPVADRIAAALAELTASDAVARLAAEGVPVAPVLERGGFLTDPWLAATRIFTTIDDPRFGPCTVIRTYAEWTRSRHEITTPAPELGADTRRVLRSIGYSDDRIADLLRTGAAREAAAS